MKDFIKVMKALSDISLFTIMKIRQIPKGGTW